MQHVMLDDLCRRATFGLTIENVTTRVWFCCRFFVIVSEPFDFIAEPEALVKVFAAFAFADKDKRTLGFDSTITRAEGDPMQLIITVHPDNAGNRPRTFLTKRLISSYGAEPLRGRGTRVFEAVEVDGRGCEKGEAVVLKDIWVDDGSTREGAILTRLYNEAGDDDRKLVKKYFLTTVCHGDVRMSGIIDDTKKGLMRELDIARGSRFKLQRKSELVLERECAPGSEGLRAISRLHALHKNLEYLHKTHYRIVFREKGITIDLIPKLCDVMTILTGTVDALQLM